MLKEEQEKRVKEITDLLGKGILTDEKLTKAYTQLGFMYLDWMRSRDVVIKEIN